MAESVLAKKLRPRRFKDLIGQEKITSALTHQLKSGRIPSAFMFSGETGSGKTTISKILGQWLQCPHKIKIGDYCKKCGRVNTVQEVNAAHYNGVEAVKELAQGSIYSPMPPAIRRVILMDEAQRLSKQAQDVLLKYTEDPPETTVWIFATTEPMSLIPTLRGRCTVSHQMRPLRGKDIDELIKRSHARGGLTRDVAPFIDLVHLRGITSGRNILNGLEQYEAGLDPDTALCAAETELDTLRICQGLLRGDWGPVRSELDKAVASDGNKIKSAVVGYLRAILVNRKPTADLKKVSKAIMQFSGIGYQDDQTVLAMVSAVLYDLCKVF